MNQSRHWNKSLRARTAMRRPGKCHGRATHSCRAYVVMLAARDGT